MSDADDAVVFKLFQDCDAKEVREAFKRRGEQLRREIRNEALEEAAMAIQKRRCEQSLHGSCGHQPCDYYARAMAAVVALKETP